MGWPGRGAVAAFGYVCLGGDGVGFCGETCGAEGDGNISEITERSEGHKQGGARDDAQTKFSFRGIFAFMLGKLSGWADTIVALATPPGIGAIGVIRVSGPEAFSIVGRLFAAKDLAAQPSHT